MNAVDDVSAKMPKPLLEAFVTTPEQAAAAEAAGADRLELCGPGDGGTTPSLEVVADTLRRVRVPVHAMLRPRPGDFEYSAAEFDRMLADAAALRRAGVQGLVFGVLRANRELDLPRMRLLTDAADGLRSVCHRAFDHTPDADAALQALLELQVDELLTSGHAETALEGAETLARHRRAARGRLSLLAGGGVRPHNVLALLQRTGLRRVHARAAPGVIAGLAAVLRGADSNLAEIPDAG